MYSGIYSNLKKEAKKKDDKTKTFSFSAKMRLKVETDSEHKANRNSLIIKYHQESRAGFRLASTCWEAVEEPIHYCCALWINCVWVNEILKLCFTLRNKKTNQTVSYSAVKYIACIHRHKNRTSPGVLVGVWVDLYQWDVRYDCSPCHKNSVQNPKLLDY